MDVEAGQAGQQEGGREGGRERERERERETDRQTDREIAKHFMLSVDPNTGLNLMNHEIMN